MVSLVKGRLRVCAADPVLEEQIGPQFGVQHCRALGERVGGARERRIAFPFDLDQGDRVLGDCARCGDNQRNRLSLPERPFLGQRRLGRGAVTRYQFEGRCPGLADGENLIGRVHGADAGQQASLVQRDRNDACVRMGAAQKGRVQQARNAHIVGVAAAARCELSGLGPGDRLTDQAAIVRACHSVILSPCCQTAVDGKPFLVENFSVARLDRAGAGMLGVVPDCRLRVRFRRKIRIERRVTGKVHIAHLHVPPLK